MLLTWAKGSQRSGDLELYWFFYSHGLITRQKVDDIIVTGETEEEHRQNLRALFKRLEENGLRANSAKCRCFQNEVEYLGFVLDEKVFVLRSLASMP